MKLATKIALIVFFSHSWLVAEESINNKPDEKAVAAKLLQRYLENLDSYQANFQQQQTSSSRRLMETTSGKFTMQRPNRFRWQIYSPYEQIIIADGKDIWSIDVDLEQVTVSTIEDNLSNSPIMLLTNKAADLTKHYSVRILKPETEESSEKITQKITTKATIEKFILQPVDNSSNFEFVLLGFQDGTLFSIELHDSLGQTTLVTMTNIMSNPILGSSQFIYEEIQGYDVIDSRVNTADDN